MPLLPTDVAMIDRLLRREGGYVDHPDDKGGPTKYGITRLTLSQYRQTPINADDVKNLTEEEARSIYYKNFLLLPGFDIVQDEHLRELLFDAGVNHGPKNATRQLQRALGVDDDGVIGNQTLRALAAFDASELWVRLIAERIKFYGNLITKNPSQAVFAAGWMNRVAELMTL